MFTPIRLFVFATIAALVTGGCGEKKTATAEPNLVERGRYLIGFGGCHDCHTPKVQGPGGVPVLDTARLLSGHPENAPYPVWAPANEKGHDTFASTNSMLTAWAGPWGVSFGINLTPDVETGIGEWSVDTFINAMRTGKHQGHLNGRDILPPMPWQSVKTLTDDDLRAVWAYLRSLPPVKNQVPFPIPPAQSAGPTAATKP